MTAGTGASGGSTGQLRADKRAAIMKGGREVFAREGYQRASIDAIAAAAQVSTRTIYKHFTDKAALFTAVIVDSAAQVAEEECALIARHLDDVTRVDEVEAALIGFAVEWMTGSAPSASDGALIGQVNAEAAHLGPEVVTTWWQAGPGRVFAEISTVLRRFDQAGLLRIADHEQAAAHFGQLVSARPGPPASPIAAEQRVRWIADGVRVFVRGYGL